MLKLIKIEKEVVIYKKMPFLVYFLKWLDVFVLTFLSKSLSLVKKSLKWWEKNISQPVDKMYAKTALTQIKPKFKRKKK